MQFWKLQEAPLLNEKIFTKVLKNIGRNSEIEAKFSSAAVKKFYPLFLVESFFLMFLKAFVLENMYRSRSTAMFYPSSPLDVPVDDEQHENKQFQSF